MSFPTSTTWTYSAAPKQELVLTNVPHAVVEVATAGESPVIPEVPHRTLGATVRFVVPKGTKVRIEDHIGGWYSLGDTGGQLLVQIGRQGLVQAGAMRTTHVRSSGGHVHVARVDADLNMTLDAADPEVGSPWCEEGCPSAITVAGGTVRRVSAWIGGRHGSIRFLGRAASAKLNGWRGSLRTGPIAWGLVASMGVGGLIDAEVLLPDSGTIAKTD
jgi:hypothetical protein